jgi:hypothetical protein
MEFFPDMSTPLAKGLTVSLTVGGVGEHFSHALAQAHSDIYTKNLTHS